MKRYFVVSLILIFVVFFSAWLWSEPMPRRIEEEKQQDEELPQELSDGEESEEKTEFIQTGEQDGARMLRVLIDGEVREMDMGTYLVGVVRSEMPASFEEEALKAQAVAARTYTLYKMQNGGSANHPDADTCDDIGCCKAYMDAAEAAEIWGAQAAEYEEKIRGAVTQTDGECVLYEGQPALTVFHSSSVGVTMDAQDVWSSAVPYLKSVESPENVETVPNYHSSASFTPEILKSLLLEAIPGADLSGSMSDWFSNMRQKENGVVSALDVGGVEIRGSKLREILGLRSACFTISFEDGRAVFSVTGYGHGVGMSQYGANVLASGGMNYREILAWYYSGTEVAIPLSA